MDKQKLIEFAKSELACWTDEGDYHQLLRIALASLEAEPVKTKFKYSSALPKFIGETNEVESVHCWIHGDTPEYATQEEAYAEARRMTGDLYTAPPAPVVNIVCPFPCGWKNLLSLAMQDAAFLARDMVEGEAVTEAHLHAVLANNDRLIKIISEVLRLNSQG